MNRRINIVSTIKVKNKCDSNLQKRRKIKKVINIIQALIIKNQINQVKAMQMLQVVFLVALEACLNEDN
jgi:hypothetical protein